MSITSFEFGLFAALVILAVQLAQRLPYRWLPRVVLLLANLYFLSTFASIGWVGLVPVFGFVLACYVFIGWLLRDRVKRHFPILLVIAFLAFFWIKKYPFVPSAWKLALPYTTIGLSYMFFRLLQLLIDARSGNVRALPHPVDYLNYLFNFPTLVSGPIQRYEAFITSQDAPARIDWIVLGRAIERIATGVFKVTVAAAALLVVHRQSQADLAATVVLYEQVFSACGVLVGYTLYLFFNFSGYTDIVIGVGRLLGIELPENFNRPFSACNFMDFWARWHMTLSNWLKTYVYNPLARHLMTRFPSPAADPYIGVTSFLVTFFLIGLWHGQTAVFVLYGLLLGLGVSGNKLYQVLMAKRLGKKGYRALAAKAWYQTAARGLTFTYFTLSLVCFWGGWAEITDLCGRLGWSGVGLTALLILAAASLVLELMERARTLMLRGHDSVWDVPGSRYLRTAMVTAMLVIATAVVTLMAAPAPDIIYKNF